MRLEIADLILCGHRGDERAGEIADVQEGCVLAYLLVPTVIGWRYSDFCTRIPLDHIIDTFPSDGGRYRMEAWLDVGYEFHCHDELYEMGETVSDDDISEDSDYEN